MKKVVSNNKNKKVTGSKPGMMKNTGVKKGIKKKAITSNGEDSLSNKGGKSNISRTKQISNSNQRMEISLNEWQKMVAEAAYYIAQNQGWHGNPSENWKAAEDQLRKQFNVK